MCRISILVRWLISPLFNQSVYPEYGHLVEKTPSMDNTMTSLIDIHLSFPSLLILFLDSRLLLRKFRFYRKILVTIVKKQLEVKVNTRGQATLVREQTKDRTQSPEVESLPLFPPESLFWYRKQYEDRRLPMSFLH
jgi:hypothetical protein